jgi:hypothetical protein
VRAAVLIALLASLMAGSSTTFRGTHNGDGAVAFRIASDGKIARFKVTHIPGKHCLTPAWGVEFRHHGLPVSNGRFRYSDPAGSFFRGRIKGNAAKGKLRFALPIAHCPSRVLYWHAKRG